MSDGLITAEDTMTAATSAVSELSKGFEHFNETGEISASIFKALGKMGINIDKNNIKDAKDFLSLMK
jgi:hypothetical protein